jgi:hypothetical protein
MNSTAKLQKRNALGDSFEITLELLTDFNKVPTSSTTRSLSLSKGRLPNSGVVSFGVWFRQAQPPVTLACRREMQGFCKLNHYSTLSLPKGTNN